MIFFRQDLQDLLDFSFGRSPAWRAIAAQSSDGGKRAPKPQSPPANKIEKNNPNNPVNPVQ
jgi:hypothetical protein